MKITSPSDIKDQWDKALKKLKWNPRNEVKKAVEYFKRHYGRGQHGKP